MFGTDPELFIVEAKSGKPVPAHRWFDDKYHPMPLAHFGKVFRDGFAVEINPTAIYCRAILNDNINRCLEFVKGVIGPYYKVISRSRVKIDPDTLADAPRDVLEFGCDPSANIYGVEPINMSAVGHPYRYAGGHLHFSYPDLAAKYSTHVSNGAALNARGKPLVAVSPEDLKACVKTWDVFIGIPLTYIFQSASVFGRRKIYGRAGEYRIQPHGLEYRTPGPEWLRNQAIATLAFGLGNATTGEGARGDYTAFAMSLDDAAVQAAINTGKGLDEMIDKLPVVDGLISPEILKATRAKYLKEVSEGIWTLEGNRTYRAKLPVLPGHQTARFNGTSRLEGHDGWGELVTIDMGMKLPGHPSERQIRATTLGGI
jgi:hypothetical protein